MKEKYINRTIKNLEKLGEKDRNLILKFRNECFSQRLSGHRVYKYTWQLYKLRQYLGKEFEQATTDDLKELVARINQMDYSECTKNDLAICLKKLYQWIKGYDWNSREYPPEVKWIRMGTKVSRKTAIKVITVEEVRKMVEAAESPRDRALVVFMFESGLRVSELLSMQIGDISFLDDSCECLIRKGKTGPRKILVVSSRPYLAEWLSAAPLKGKEDPLWHTYRGRIKVIEYSSLRQLLRNLGEKAGISGKRLNPHTWRHSACTATASWMPESVQKAFFGWSATSRTPGIYTHMNAQIMTDTVRRKHGLLSEDAEKDSLISPKKCSLCRAINRAESTRCSSCGHALDLKTAMEDQQKLVESLADSQVFQALVDARTRKIVQEVVSRLNLEAKK